MKKVAGWSNSSLLERFPTDDAGAPVPAGGPSLSPDVSGPSHLFNFEMTLSSISRF